MNSLFLLLNIWKLLSNGGVKARQALFKDRSLKSAAEARTLHLKKDFLKVEWCRMIIRLALSEPELVEGLNRAPAQIVSEAGYSRMCGFGPVFE
jgi:hypothetical protein